MRGTDYLGMLKGSAIQTPAAKFEFFPASPKIQFPGLLSPAKCLKSWNPPFLASFKV